MENNNESQENRVIGIKYFFLTQLLCFSIFVRWIKIQKGENYDM